MPLPTLGPAAEIPASRWHRRHAAPPLRAGPNTSSIAIAIAANHLPSCALPARARSLALRGAPQGLARADLSNNTRMIIAPAAVHAQAEQEPARTAVQAHTAMLLLDVRRPMRPDSLQRARSAGHRPHCAPHRRGVRGARRKCPAVQLVLQALSNGGFASGIGKARLQRR